MSQSGNEISQKLVILEEQGSEFCSLLQTTNVKTEVSSGQNVKNILTILLAKENDDYQAESPVKVFIKKQMQLIADGNFKSHLNEINSKLLTTAYSYLYSLFVTLENFDDNEIVLFGAVKLPASFKRYLGSANQQDGRLKYNINEIFLNFVKYYFGLLKKAFSATSFLSESVLLKEAVQFHRHFHILKFIADTQGIEKALTGSDDDFLAGQLLIAHLVKCEYFDEPEKKLSERTDDLEKELNFARESQNVYLQRFYNDFVVSSSALLEFKSWVHDDYHQKILGSLQNNFVCYLRVMADELSRYADFDQNARYQVINTSYCFSMMIMISEMSYLWVQDIKRFPNKREDYFEYFNRFLLTFDRVFRGTSLYFNDTFQVLMKALNAFNNLFLLLQKLRNLCGESFDHLYGSYEQDLCVEFFVFMQQWESIRKAQQDQIGFAKFDVKPFEKKQREFSNSFIPQFLKDIGRLPQDIGDDILTAMVADLEKPNADLIKAKTANNVLNKLLEKAKCKNNVKSEKANKLSVKEYKGKMNSPPHKGATPLGVGGSKKTKNPSKVVNKRISIAPEVSFYSYDEDDTNFAVATDNANNSPQQESMPSSNISVVSFENPAEVIESINDQGVGVFNSKLEILSVLAYSPEYANTFVKKIFLDLITLTSAFKKFYSDLASVVPFKKSVILEQARLIKNYFYYLEKSLILCANFKSDDFSLVYKVKMEWQKIKADFDDSLSTSVSIAQLSLASLGEMAKISDLFNNTYMEKFDSFNKKNYRDIYSQHLQMLAKGGVGRDCATLIDIPEDGESIPLTISVNFHQHYLPLQKLSRLASQMDLYLERLIKTYSSLGEKKLSDLRNQLFEKYHTFCGNFFILITRAMAKSISSRELKKQLRYLEDGFKQDVLIPCAQGISLLNMHANNAEVKNLWEKLSSYEEEEHVFLSSKSISHHLFDIYKCHVLDDSADHAPLSSLIEKIDSYLDPALLPEIKQHYYNLIESLKLVSEIDKYLIQFTAIKLSEKRLKHFKDLRGELYQNIMLFADRYLWTIDRYQANVVFWQSPSSCDEELTALFNSFSQNYLVPWAQKCELLPEDKQGATGYSMLVSEFSYKGKDPVLLPCKFETSALHKEGEPIVAFLESYNFANNFKRANEADGYGVFYAELRRFIEDTQDSFYGIDSKTEEDHTQPTGWIRRRDALNAKPLNELRFTPDDPRFDVYNYLQRSLQTVRGIDYTLQILQQYEEEGNFLTEQRQLLFFEYQKFSERCLFGIDKLRMELSTVAEAAGFLKQQEIDFNSTILAPLIQRCGLDEGIEKPEEYRQLLNYFRRRATLLDPARTIETVYRDDKTGLQYVRSSYPVTRKTIAQEKTLRLIRTPELDKENYHTRKVEAYQTIDQIFRPLMLLQNTRLSSDDIHDIAATAKNTFVEVDKIYKPNEHNEKVLAGFRFFIRGTVSAYVGNGGEKNYRRDVRNTEAKNNYDQIKLNLAHVLQKELLDQGIKVDVKHDKTDGYVLQDSNGKKLTLDFDIQTLVTNTRINREDKVVSVCKVVAQDREVSDINTPVNILSKIFGGNSKEEREEIEEISLLNTKNNFFTAVNKLRVNKREDRFFEFTSNAQQAIQRHLKESNCINTQIVGCFQGKDRTSKVVFASFLEFDNDMREATGNRLGANLSMEIPKSGSSSQGEVNLLQGGFYNEDLVAIHSPCRHELAVTDDALPGSLGLKKRSRQACFSKEHDTHFHTDAADTEKKHRIDEEKIIECLKKPENQQQFVINVEVLKNKINDFIEKRESSLLSKIKKFEDKKKALAELSKLLDIASKGELVDKDDKKITSVVDVMHQWLIKNNPQPEKQDNKNEKELKSLIEKDAVLGKRRWGLWKPKTVEFLEDFSQDYKETEIAAKRR